MSDVDGWHEEERKREGESESLLCLYHPLIDFDQTDFFRASIARTYEQTYIAHTHMNILPDKTEKTRVKFTEQTATAQE